MLVQGLPGRPKRLPGRLIGEDATQSLLVAVGGVKIRRRRITMAYRVRRRINGSRDYVC